MAMEDATLKELYLVTPTALSARDHLNTDRDRSPCPWRSDSFAKGSGFAKGGDFSKGSSFAKGGASNGMSSMLGTGV